MGYCDRCGKSIEGQSGHCPDCGRKLPRIVGEVTNDPWSTQSMQETEQVSIENASSIQWEHGGQGTRMPVERGREISMELILVIVGSLMAICSAFIFFRTSALGFSLTMGMDSLDAEFAYVWLIPISGLILIILTLYCFFKQKENTGKITMIFGILAIIIPLLFAAHFSSDGTLSFGEVFYFSETTSGYGFSSTFSNVFIGGIMSMIGGVLIFLGGWMFSRKAVGSGRNYKLRVPKRDLER